MFAIFNSFPDLTIKSLLSIESLLAFDFFNWSDWLIFVSLNFLYPVVFLVLSLTTAIFLAEPSPSPFKSLPPVIFCSVKSTTLAASIPDCTSSVKVAVSKFFLLKILLIKKLSPSAFLIASVVALLIANVSFAAFFSISSIVPAKV